MNHSAITVRYAKAFFSTAKEKKMLETLKTDMELVLNVCNNSADFIILLNSPIVKTSIKADLISTIFKEKVNALTLKFLLLITSNKREIQIPGICRNFLDLTRKDQNIKSAVLTTATEINKKTIDKIESLMSDELGAKVELTSKVNAKIIGGMILRIEDKQYDASIVTQLNKIKQQLLEAEL